MQFLSFLFSSPFFYQLLSFSGDVTVGFFTAGWTRVKGSSLLLSSSCSANLTHSRVVSELLVRSARLKRGFPLVDALKFFLLGAHPRLNLLVAG